MEFKIVFLAIATWYGIRHEGMTMANGEPFHKEDFTCASYLYPLGTYLEVMHEGQSVLVEVTDRCDNKTDIDLSYAAFEKIANPDLGRIQVIVSFDYDEQTKDWKSKSPKPSSAPELSSSPSS